MHFRLIFSLVISVLTAIGQAAAEEIRVYTWEGYFSEEVITQFELETGHSVTFGYFDNEPLRDEVVSSGRTSNYDLFILDVYTLRLFEKQDRLAAIDRSKMKNSRYLESDASKACGEFGIPYSQGSMGIGYRESKTNQEFNSWMDLFDYASEHPGAVVIPSQELDTSAVALLALGYNPMTGNESELKQAYNLLVDVRDDLLALRNGDGYALDYQERSLMDVAVVYSGETESIANATGQDDWTYVVPREGTLMWYECLSATSDNPPGDAELEFLDYINRPEIAAKNAQDIWFATTNSAALALTGEEYRKDSELFAEKTGTSKIYHYEAMDTKSTQLRNRILTILSGD